MMRSAKNNQVEQTTHDSLSQDLNYLERHIVNFSYIKAKKGESFYGINKSSHAILFVLKGSLCLSYNSHLNCCFKTGEMLLVPQGAKLHCEILEPSDILTSTFDAHFELIFKHFKFDRSVFANSKFEFEFTPLVMDQAILQFTNQIQDYINLNIESKLLNSIKIKELFLLLNHGYPQKQIAMFFYPLMEITSFKCWVLEHYQYNTTLNKLAELYHLTPKSFARQFTREFGVTFRQWSLSRKKERIILRLSMPEVTFADIIEEFKFSDPHSFYSFCKKHYNCTARELLTNIRK